jgi:starch phosphorylase
MEIGLDASIPTYAGGLGVLAGDTVRAAADLGIDMVAVTLLHREGYFRQHLDARGNQTESPYQWTPERFLEPMQPRVKVSIEGREVQLRAWRYVVHGVSGRQVTVYFLDAGLPENTPSDQAFTDYLYGGDNHYRLCQEAVLGLGGVAMLKALGHGDIATYHMNEGHAALLALALLEEQTKKRGLRGMHKADIEAVRRRCVFTTHTPVAAGHDKFPWDLVVRTLGDEKARALEAAGCRTDNTLNMTHLALSFSRYINGVSMRHELISRGMFPGYPIRSITNGVHAATWAAPPLRRLYDHYFPEWRRDNAYLRYAMDVPEEEIRQAHSEAKEELMSVVERRTGVRLNPRALTIGFARRSTPYKRADMVFSDLERLRKIARRAGPIQIIYGGKSHPRDEGGKELIRRVSAAATALRDAIPVVYMEEYDIGLAKHICSGVDLWLNNPHKPHEASGTSGMKAALNGVPSLSVLDGWWVEGHVEGITGWAIGDDQVEESDPAAELDSLYDKLEYLILPTFYDRPDAYGRIMRCAIALNGSFFNAQRMVSQYLENAYLAAD